MKKATKIFMCFALMGFFTMTTGCDDMIVDEFLGEFLETEYWGADDAGWGYSDGTYQGNSSSGTFFSDYGGSISWW